ncbi:MAG: hypothetical protein HYV28_18460 [Ignavibacteriales bacterium]|nr:hypothetical protein [Ignavibacteriales bacterium]
MQAYTEFIKAVYGNIPKVISLFFQSKFIRNKTGYIWCLLCLLFVLNSIACKKRDITTIANGAAPYNLVGNDNTTTVYIKTQFPRYYFLPGEKRNIFVYGLTDLNYFEALSSGITFFANNTFNNNQDNMYCEKISNGNLRFTIPLEIAANPNTQNQSASITVQSGSGSTFLNIYVGEKREFHITRYLYFSNSDLFNNSIADRFPELTTSAFAAAKTKVFFDEKKLLQSSNIIPSSNDPDVIKSGVQIWSAYNQICAAQGIINYLSNGSAFLGSLYEVSTNILLEKVSGQSLNNPEHSITMLYHKRIETEAARIITNLLYRPTYMSAIAIHELGHARGRSFSGNDGYCQNDITNSDHSFGQNGIKNSECVMRIGYQSGAALINTLNYCGFCEGHLQMLFNAEW